MPIHSYDFAKKFLEYLEEELIRLKIPGIVDIYESEGKCEFYYHHCGKYFLLRLTESENSMLGTKEYYKSDDMINQIIKILDNSNFLMQFS